LPATYMGCYIETVAFNFIAMEKKTARRAYKMTLRLSESENNALYRIAEKYDVSRMEAVRKLITKESSNSP